jgi:hypothetical protein
MVRRLLWKNSGDIRKAIAANGGRQYDVLIASDIVALPYLDYIPDLLDVISKLLASDGVFYLAYQRRHSSEEIFFEQLRARNFSLEEIPRKRLHKDFREISSISIFMIRNFSN